MHRLTLPILLALTACATRATPAPGGPSTPPVPALTPTAPVWVSATARAAGRSGTDLAVFIVADDPNRDLATLRIRTLDAKGVPVEVIDFDSAAEKTFVIDPVAAAGATRVTDAVLLPGAYPVSLQFRPAQVELELVDLAGLVSETRRVPIAAQVESVEGAACDPDELESRCVEGLSCEGAPATCVEAGPPVIEAAAYFRTLDGAAVVLEGRAPNDDVATVRMRFLDAQGNAFAPDFDDDGSPDENELVQQVEDVARRGRFQHLIEPTVVFPEKVAQVGLSVADAFGRGGDERRVRLDDRPVRGLGERCRPEGFDRCAETLFCDAASPSPTCVSKVDLMQRRCGSARGLDPAKGMTRTTGRVRGASLVDPPPGCQAQAPAGMPEGFVPLHLEADVSRLVLSTEGPATTLDTHLTLLVGRCEAAASGLEPVASCDGSPCCADGPGAGATLTLTSLPAGDYVVVVDSTDRIGGEFTLEAAVDSIELH